MNAPQSTEVVAAMNAETLEALRGSIAKWQGIVAGTVKDQGQDNCPLCQMFFYGGCYDCPVRNRTGRRGCKKTPYDTFGEAELERDVAGMAAAAKAEVEFLKSLLPENVT